jgi:hypothetical protein
MPVAKLMIRGRQQPIVLGPELQHAEGVLADQGISLRFDPAFAAPLADTSSDGFWFLTRRSSAICDGCGASMIKGSGRYVPSVFFRHSDALANWLVQHSGGGEFGLFHARRSWTGWLLCDSCADEVATMAGDPGGAPP